MLLISTALIVDRAVLHLGDGKDLSPCLGMPGYTYHPASGQGPASGADFMKSWECYWQMDVHHTEDRHGLESSASSGSNNEINNRVLVTFLIRWRSQVT